MSIVSSNPLISVIVPVYKVEEFLPRCAESIINQTYKNLEIIFVDDGSPDNCGALCDFIAATDPRVKVIHQENGGLSAARNSGLEIATGEFIGFVDSDDFIDEHMYEYLLRAFDNHPGIDISICGYYISNDTNAAANKSSDIVYVGRDAMVALLNLKFGNYAWNKLYKKSLWDGVRYPVGKNYEDVLTTYKVVEKSAKVVVIKEPLYYYRDNPNGIVREPTIKNAAACLYARMERFELICDRYGDCKDAVINDMIRFIWALRETISTKPESEFNANIQLISDITAFFRKYADDFIRIGKWGKGGRYCFNQMMKGTYKAWLNAQHVHNLYLDVERFKNSYRESKFKKFVIGTAEQKDYSYYCKMRKAPIDRKSVFMESRGGVDFASNIYYIAEELCRRGFKVHLSVWENDVPKVQDIIDKGTFTGLTIVHKRSREYYLAAATSWLCFDDMTYNDNLVKREGQIWVNPWHGIPLKTLGFDIIGQSYAEGGMAREFMATDYMTSSSGYYRDCMLHATNISNIWNGKVLNTGYPRNSVLCDHELGNQIKKKMGLEDKEVFIYMPTWRGTFNTSAADKGKFEINSILSFIDNNLNDNQIMFAKLHNLSAASVNFGNFSRVKPFPKEFENYAFLSAADCLITDYSSVFFDYASTRKKIILFTYDREEYMAGRGTYMDFDELPFTRVDTYGELASELNLEIRYDDSNFLQKYCTFDKRSSVTDLIDFLTSDSADNTNSFADRTDLSVSDTIDESDTSQKLTESIVHNGKKNILVYDSDMMLDSYDSSKTEEAIQGFDPTEANYYFGFRQNFVNTCPSVMKKLPEGWYFYGLAPYPTMTVSDTRRKALGLEPSKEWIKRETQRQFWGQPFDDVIILGDNKDDPYLSLLKVITK